MRMGDAFLNINLHIVFSVKHREPLIAPEMRKGLYQKIGSIIQQQKSVLLEIGGVADHVHLLVRWLPHEGLPVLMRKIKAESSGWLRRQFPEKAHFQWQRGYSAFSVSEAIRGTVAEYIRNQESHHQQQNFADELKSLLEEHGLAFESSSEEDSDE
jgi:putative transposase